MHRAIETRYAGYRFRSRLEARYAVLFDSLKIKWDYEPEGFELGGGERYLPDFWLPLPDRPEWGYWVEIKALPPTPEELRLMVLLCAATKHHGWFFCGAPSASSIAVLSGSKSAPSLLCESAPITACTPELTRRHVENACIDATSARFEFKDAARRRRA